MASSFCLGLVVLRILFVSFVERIRVGVVQVGFLISTFACSSLRAACVKLCQTTGQNGQGRMVYNRKDHHQPIPRMEINKLLLLLQVEMSTEEIE